MSGSNDDFWARRKKLLPAGVSSPVIVARQARGSKIIDTDGKEYIDFISGIGVMAAGHTQEFINQAVKDQINRFSHTCFGVIGYDSYLELGEKLVKLFPHGFNEESKKPIAEKTKVFLTNSGSDSVENAIKIARAYTRRGGIIAFTHAFHGRHYMGMTLTDKPKNRKYCGPLPSEVFRLRFPSYFHYGQHLTRENYLDQEIASLKSFFKNEVNPEEIAAVIFEPIQGEGGFVVMPPKYLCVLKEICKKHKILMIVDEVQSGFGRTGRWAAYQHYDHFTPDLSVWAKAMGAGYPIGAVIGRQEIMDDIPPGILGGTYLGNPIACVAGNAAITYMEEVDLPTLASMRGEVIRKKLEEFYETYDVVGEVRGMGAMLAIEFCEQRQPEKINSELTRELVRNCRESGLLLISARNGNVVRILCPLNIEMDLLEKGLGILEQELKKIISKNKA